MHIECDDWVGIVVAEGYDVTIVCFLVVVVGDSVIMIDFVVGVTVDGDGVRGVVSIARVRVDIFVFVNDVGSSVINNDVDVDIGVSTVICAWCPCCH